MKYSHGSTIAFIIVLLITILYVCVVEGSEIAIKTIAYEASNQPFAGQQAVASVIKTRMLERNQTAEQVCLAKSQFSCWRNGKPTQRRKLKPKEIEQARLAWQTSHEDSSGANIYMRTDCKPQWVTEGLKKGVLVELYTIKDHVFYREW